MDQWTTAHGAQHAPLLPWHPRDTSTDRRRILRTGRPPSAADADYLYRHGACTSVAGQRQWSAPADLKCTCFPAATVLPPPTCRAGASRRVMRRNFECASVWTVFCLFVFCRMPKFIHPGFGH